MKEERMFRIAFSICLMFILAIPMSSSHAEDISKAIESNESKKISSDDPVKSLERIVFKFESFFGSPKILLYKQIYYDSPLFYLCKYTATSDISYDVQKTNSLVSPYVGYIYITVVGQKNGSCGNIAEFGGNFHGWSTAVEAIRAKDKEECFKDPLPDPLKFVFAYQRDRWVIKHVIRTEYGNEKLAIGAALGIEAGPARVANEPEAQVFNKGWRDLITQ
jgi:hypothetical protein